jgi:fructoselysine and glucoselysine-specific PTS system IIA component
MAANNKTRKFLIATHGALAKGISSSLDIIAGQMENVHLIQAYLDENKSIEEELKSLVGDQREEEEWVIFSDLLGGSITNQILRVALRENVHVVAGFNLPVVLDILLADAESPLEAVIEQAIINAREQLVYVNKLINQKKGEGSYD